MCDSSKLLLIIFNINQYYNTLNHQRKTTTFVGIGIWNNVILVNIIIVIIYTTIWTKDIMLVNMK